MAKLPHPTTPDDFFEAPTEKRNIPAELLDPPPPPQVRVTTKLRKVDLDQLVAKERAVKGDQSGMRVAVSDDEIERYELRERRETLPAPPEEELPADLEPRAESGKAR